MPGWSPLTLLPHTGVRAGAGRLPFVLGGILLLTGCQDPLRRQEDEEIHRAWEATFEREAGSAVSVTQPAYVQAPVSEVFEALKGRRGELDALGPQARDGGPGLDTGPDILPAAQPEVILSLRQAVESAVENNLAVQIARLDEAITQTEITRAEAVFDTVLFASGGYTRSNQPQPVVNLGGGGGASC